MFKNLFAKFGYGSAKIDLILDKSNYQLGEIVSGQLAIQGGNVAQQINKIDVDLMLSIYKDNHEHVKMIERFPFHQSFQIHPGESRVFPFSYTLPNNLPISAATVNFYFMTTLDIAGGVDSSDRDYIQIEPPLPLQKILSALNQLGFHEKHDSREFEGYAQEFELAPISGAYMNQVKELEFFAIIDPDSVYLLLEVEKSSFMGNTEIKREIQITNQLLDQPTELITFLDQTISDTMSQSHGFGNHFSRFGSDSHSFGGSSGHKTGMSSALGGAAVGAIGGFAAGMLTSHAINSIMGDDDDDDDGDDENSFFGGNESDEENDDDSGDFFDDGDDSDDFFED